MKKYFYSMMALCVAISLTACGSDDSSDNGGGSGTGDDDDSFVVTAPSATSLDEGTNFSNPSESDYVNKTYGQKAVSACAALGDELVAANTLVQKRTLTEGESAYLKAVFANLVDNVIVPTYTKLADNTEDLEKTLNGLDVNSLTDAKIEKACEDFANARSQWEQSEAFLGGAASDFSIDPTIDSWPLSRSSLLAYFNGQLSLDYADESILGFHALEFVLFRNGKARKAADFQTNDTYSGFEGVTGAQELKYAQEVCKLLKERTYQLQVSWEGATSANAARLAVVKEAGLKYQTTLGQSFGDNLKNAGNTKVSTFATVKDAVEQLLSAEEGSAYGITNEVGTAKIGHPFSEGKISYVESPYSYRSILDFQDNIRSVRNIWFGTTTGKSDPNVKCFATYFNTLGHDYFTEMNSCIGSAISAIGGMPSPFVKYCCKIYGKEFSEEEYVDDEE